MSEFVSHTPEDLSKKPNLQDRVDKVADLVGNLMGTSNADEEAWIKRAGIFQQIQTEVGYGFRNAGDLLLVQNDDSKTGKQKELAKEAEELLVLGTAKALIGGSNEDKEAIGVGSIMKIKERLPEELNGLEKKVRDSIIDEPEIQKILDPLDIVRKRVAKAGETGQKVLEDQINKALEKLILLEVDSTKEDQLGMVVEWLGREKEGGLEEKNRVGYNRGNDNYRSESEDVGEIQDDGVPEILEGLEDIDSEARQLAQVRKVLDMIESQRDIDNIYKAGGWISALETKIESMYPKVALEVNSRLKLKHCDYFMKLSAGWIYREGGLTMSGAADALQSRGRELGREEIRFLFNPDGANGIPVSVAWDSLQEANYNYENLLSEMMASIEAGQFDIGGSSKDGRKRQEIINRIIAHREHNLMIKRDNDPELGDIKVNYYADSGAVKEMAREYLITKLSGDGFFRNSTISQEEKKNISEKAIYLAESLAVATQEVAVWNRGTLVGNNELADMIGISYWRGDRDQKGRPVGPRFHLNLIDNIGATSWLRYTVSLKSDDRILPKEHLKASQVYDNIDNFVDGGYQYFFSVFISGKIFPLFGLLKDRVPLPKDINHEFLKKAVDYFNKADQPMSVLVVDKEKDLYVPIIHDREKRMKYAQLDGERKMIGSLDRKEYVDFGKERVSFVDNKNDEITDPDGVRLKVQKVNGEKYVIYNGRRYEVNSGDLPKRVNLGGRDYEITKAKTGPEHLKVLWLAGVVQMATTNSLLDWNLDSIRELGRMASEQELSPEAGTFITKRQWNEIMERLDVYKAMRKLQRQRRIRGSRQKDFIREA